jgi:predicted transcriptional regulator
MTKPISEALHRHDYAYITADGAIYQVDNQHFSGKQIGTADLTTDLQLDEVLKPFTNTFADLVRERDQVLEQLKATEDGEHLKHSFMSKAESALAVGDFDALIQPVSSYSTTSVQTTDENSMPTFEMAPDEAEEEVEELLADQNPELAHLEPVPTTDELHHDDQPVAEHESAEEAEEEVAAPETEAKFVPALALYTEGDPHYAYELLVLKAEEIAASTDWQYGQHELDNIRFKWDELSPKNDQAQKDLSQRLQKAIATFNERRSTHFEKMTQVRAANLVRKKELLERLETIVRDGRWNAINELKSLERRWEKIRQVSAEEAEKLQTRFNALRKTFEEKRIDFLVKRKEREEEHLNIKMLILDKLDILIQGINEATSAWDNLEKTFEGLTQQWRKVGPVVLEKEDEIWARFRSAVDAYQQKKLTFNKAYKAELEKNLNKKTQLCEQAEALMQNTDLLDAARIINKLHRDWKETGPVAKELSEELWQRFKKASDTFNEYKNANMDQIRDVENANYEAKEKLCEEAEALLESTDFAKAAREMQALTNQWRTIGPVPRRKTKAVWTRFKTAMDTFFSKRRETLKDSRRVEKDNFKAKKEIIDQISKLLELDDPQQAVTEIRPLQDAYQKIGFVPMKYKNKLWAKYKEACDAVYQRAREERAARSIQKANETATAKKQRSGSGEQPSGQKRMSDVQRIKKECDDLQQLILHYSDTKTFIKPSKQGNKLRDDIQAKIDAAQAKLYSKQEELEQLKRDASAS